ncbi:putative chemotaxis protein CheX [Xanthomonas oryzae pv. oryzae PXO99A]|uniref:Putative chemotaxis protein CheX n=1 Tax=Xanthomonas oryzae pv. oryzae (strain PXO99A) TaxID=360094 RepID=A0A0K0GMA0_XANOP|nr:putative chemotaxis protein CheX [Xanthomonas oryzae pv. oryzae PXO99A]
MLTRAGQRELTGFGGQHEIARGVASIHTAAPKPVPGPTTRIGPVVRAWRGVGPLSCSTARCSICGAG